MSNTDSFIDEVTEEVRRDRVFDLARRYGWIAVLAVLLLVGGAAWREYTKAQEISAAQAFGDAILAALKDDAPSDRITALHAITPSQEGGEAILSMLIAAEEANADNDADATATLQAIADNPQVPMIYRQIASYKALSRAAGTLSAEDRRAGFEALSVPGQPLRLLAEEQLALIDIETGDTDAAISRLERIIADSEVTAGLRRRASQLIVSLGGTLGAA
ncbi:hypothetical protein [Puniceibacterium sp. IMCC21224]|uniref:hypothetical protein n=1 Tax=Puniceibacterium sp. IMCC21224 TaxID=1618204 RepID=UPI00064DE218|nr:hypothetical protein [Puniceibacterium sp. IMCC21224]KMK66784.1 hypothetical protein IMCC21224_111641 [Puniceibacterium sp. IMCC21224]